MILPTNAQEFVHFENIAMMMNHERPVMSASILKLGFIYFILVFAAGFVLGIIRVLWLVPRVGVRTAELLEMPLMIAVSVVAARWLVRRYNVPRVISTRLAIGVLALIVLLIAEFGIAARLQGISITEAITNRDPVSGAVYFVSLGIFALMPALLSLTSRDY